MKKIIFLLMLMFTINACKPLTHNTNITFENPSDLQSALTDNGKIIELMAPAGWNSYKSDDSIVLMVRNMSDKDILSPYDFNVRIYIKSDNGNLVLVNNKTIYPDSEEIVLLPNREFDPLKVKSLIVYPDIDPNLDSVDLRIFILGVISGDESQEVATFVDVKLHP